MCTKMRKMHWQEYCWYDNTVSYRCGYPDENSTFSALFIIQSHLLSERCNIADILGACSSDTSGRPNKALPSQPYKSLSRQTDKHFTHSARTGTEAYSHYSQIRHSCRSLQNQQPHHHHHLSSHTGPPGNITTLK